ncbi:hypothetical protein ACR79S_00525 [Sphingobacterium spiritivorum]|uniref:hypothetical protein n=1 Tax=Sphingobacterium spiritivorum TaxID=258 RepID=UPI003DA3CFC8
MKKNLPILSVVILFLVLCCKKSGTGDVEQNQQTDKENLPGYVKLLEVNFAVKSDGSLWGWGGLVGYANGYTRPRELLKGGVKDFQQGFVVKNDGTLWHMGKVVPLTSMSSSCGPYKGKTLPLGKGVEDYEFVQLSSDANWVKVGVKNNGYIYNVVATPSFQYSYWDLDMCKGWWRDLNYVGSFWQITSKYNDWKYTNVVGGIGLRSNGILYEIASYNYLSPQYTAATYPDILKSIDSNVAEVLFDNGVLVYKKNDGTIWYKWDKVNQIDGNWKSMIVSPGIRFVGIKTDGTLWAWGYNGDGFLGDGGYTNQVQPLKISDKMNWLQVSGDGSFYTALDNEGNIYGWGKNDRGQLGDGTKVDKYKPTLVIPAT